MTIPLMVLIIFPFSLGVLMVTWQSLLFFLALLPLATALRLQPSGDGFYGFL